MHLVILTTCPDEATANRIAKTLVAERLAACVNRMVGVQSTYRWQDEVRDEPEMLLIIKTTQERYGALETRLKTMHPYEVPEIIALPVAAGSEDYLAWVSSESRAPDSEQ